MSNAIDVTDSQWDATVLQSTTQYKYNSIYLRALDGGVWHLGPERSSWAKLTVTEP